MYWAEKALLKAIPKMIKNASSQDLVNALNEHLMVTEEQVQKVEEVFESIGEKVSAKKCEAMAGLIKEAEEIMSDLDKGSVRDAGIICAAQKVEHYEIATYGCLSTYAEILNEMEAYQLLEEILEEEKDADETLTQIAREINWEAAEEDEDEDEYDEEEEEEETEEEDDDDNEDDDEDTRDQLSELDAIQS
jgi:ferritin-like metal-binding protein YciE